MLAAKHALLSGLREAGSETELTRVLASLFGADPVMAGAFVRLAVSEAPRGMNIDLGDLPAMLSCVAEKAVSEGRADLSFTDQEGRWHVIVENKVYAGYGHDQIRRYLRSLDGTERGVVVAITRDVPTYGDLHDDDPRWAGSVRWGQLLPYLRQLPVADPELKRQWPLFLDILEEEGAMGFTRPKSELFRAWADYPASRAHLVDFVDSVRLPLLDALRLVLTGDPDPDSPVRLSAADFATRGKAQKAVTPRLGTIRLDFRIPAGSSDERLTAGLWGWGDPRFMVAVPFPSNTVDIGRRAVAVSALMLHGFDNWKDRWLTRYLPLSRALLGDADKLTGGVVQFASKSFAIVAQSGILALEPATPSSDDEEEPSAA